MNIFLFIIFLLGLIFCINNFFRYLIKKQQIENADIIFSLTLNTLVFFYLTLKFLPKTWFELNLINLNIFNLIYFYIALTLSFVNIIILIKKNKNIFKISCLTKPFSFFVIFLILFVEYLIKEI